MHDAFFNRSYLTLFFTLFLFRYTISWPIRISLDRVIFFTSAAALAKFSDLYNPPGETVQTCPKRFSLQSIIRHVIFRVILIIKIFLDENISY